MSLRVVALTLGLLLVACDDLESRPNLILISLDTTRADHLGSYGNRRDATPNLDSFAASANRYQNAFAPGPWTYTSHIEMLTGQIPQEIGVYTGRVNIPKSIPIFAEQLARAGYQNTAYVDSPSKGYVGAKRGFGRGFHRYRHAPHRTNMPLEIDAKVTAKMGMEWIKSKWDQERPFFLFLHTKTAHKLKVKFAHEDYRNPPYDVPDDRFRFISEEQAAYVWQDPELGNGGDLLGSLTDAYVLGERHPENFPTDQLATLEGLYDGALFRIDQAFGELVLFLRKRDLYENTLIIVTADHGEEFLEHGLFNHHQLYQETTRIPLIVKFPGQTEGRVVKENVRLADIAPTLLAAAGIEIGPELRGIALRETGTRIDPERLIFGASYKPKDTKGVRRKHLSLRRGEWSLIYRIQPKTGEKSLELFNRAVDPGERSPVLDEPERVAEMWDTLQAWHESWRPLGNETLQLDDKTQEHLRALGYAE